MSVTIRNYPRKPLSDRERTIRETLSRIDGSGSHPPYVYVAPADASTLQGEITTLAGGGGGVIWLDKGTYNAGNLTVPLGDDVVIMGSGMNDTILTGNLTLPGNSTNVSNLWIKGTSQAYGVKLFNATAGPNRHDFKKVRIGGTTNWSDGPTGPGVWLDGAILNVFDHCLIAFNGDDGVYINTTDPSAGSFTTNVNTFRDCTINLNDGWGLKTETGADGIAGMQQNVFIGGNMENNAQGAAYIKGSYWTRLDNVDIESSINLGTTFSTPNQFGGWLINGDSSSYIIIENCSIRSTGDTGRIFVFSSCGFCRFVGNRITGNFPTMDTGVFDEGCQHCVAYDNAFTDPYSASAPATVDIISPRWISNRSQSWGWSP